jgi:D-sedoheptulose 7-phosphate isomerase
MEKVKSIISSSIKVKNDFLHDESNIDKLLTAVEAITRSLRNGGRIFFCGNGGSAADAQHLAAELSGRFYTDRPALNADALHANTSYMTAVANDYSYDVVYQRIIEGIGTEKDVLIGLTTSGNSKNVVYAFNAARVKKMTTISLTGERGGDIKTISDIWLGVPSNDTPRIQECHILIGHIICQLVEENMFAS